MSPSARRVIIPIIVGLAALAVVVTVMMRPPRQPAPPLPPGDETAHVEPVPGEDAPPGDAAGAPPEQQDENAGPPAAELPPLQGLHAVAPEETEVDDDWLIVGSLDPRAAPLEVRLTPIGAGIERIAMADIWDTAGARRQAERHWAAVAAGDADPPPLPDERLRYVLAVERPLRGLIIPVLAAHMLEVDGTRVELLFESRDGGPAEPVSWATVGPGSFEIVVADEFGEPVLAVRRTYSAGDNGDITLKQEVQNRSGRDLSVRWMQWGPVDLFPDRARYMDRRRFRFGYLLPAERDPQQRIVQADPSLLLERSEVLKRDERDEFLLWPNDASRDDDYALSWFAATNRYFALAVHPVLNDPDDSRAIAPVVSRIGQVTSDAPEDDDRVVFTQLFSETVPVPAGTSLHLDLGVYAGPLDRKVLSDVQPYAALGMRYAILYQISGCCAICTFQWLAELLLGFLDIVHMIVRDWGLAIIALVGVVRLLLHPLTKKAQISMSRMTKVMGNLKPELDRLQKKYADDAAKLRTEQMRLYREQGVNPVQFLGCLPMFLQTPIWIALYAMLYFAWDIRHEPAFYGIFQKVSGGYWPFLADLSAADHCFGEFAEPVHFFFWNITGINMLPLLMGVIFFFQQKYMSPPPSPTMTKEQLQQQRLMKIMMVVLFPLMLYSAPSGLTLYILTSSTIGILESRYIRRHINELDLAPPKPKQAKKKPRDPLGRAYADALERAQARRREKQQPRKSFKKRR